MGFVRRARALGTLIGKQDEASEAGNWEASTVQTLFSGVHSSTVAPEASPVLHPALPWTS